MVHPVAHKLSSCCRRAPAKVNHNPRAADIERAKIQKRRPKAAVNTATNSLANAATMFTLSSGERAGVRASVSLRLGPCFRRRNRVAVE
jgi:hypothetical protein